MRKPVIITTPYPTLEQIRAESNVSAKEFQELVEIADRLIARRRNKKTRKQKAAPKKSPPAKASKRV